VDNPNVDRSDAPPLPVKKKTVKKKKSAKKTGKKQGKRRR